MLAAGAARRRTAGVTAAYGKLGQTATRRGTVCNRETGGKEGDGVLEDGFWAVCGYVGRQFGMGGGLQRVFR